jgi:hypothetical protein
MAPADRRKVVRLCHGAVGGWLRLYPLQKAGLGRKNDFGCFDAIVDQGT